MGLRKLLGRLLQGSLLKICSLHNCLNYVVNVRYPLFNFRAWQLQVWHRPLWSVIFRVEDSNDITYTRLHKLSLTILLFCSSNIPCHLIRCQRDRFRVLREFPKKLSLFLWLTFQSIYLLLAQLCAFRNSWAMLAWCVERRRSKFEALKCDSDVWHIKQRGFPFRSANNSSHFRQKTPGVHLHIFV